MTIVLYIICMIAFLKLIFISSISVDGTKQSRFELSRLAKKGESASQSILEREVLLRDLLSVQRALVAVLIVIIVASAIAACGWPIGLLLSVVVALEFGAIARLPVIRRNSQRVYEKYEAKLLEFMKRHPRLFSILRSVTHEGPRNFTIGSRDELRHLIDQADGHILTSREKERLLAGLVLESMTVFEYMTKRDQMTTIESGELLGPLVLDDLHKSGQRLFPVTQKSQIVGVLDIGDTTDLSTSKRSLTAEKAMSSTLFYIQQDQSVLSALETFARTGSQLLFVIDTDESIVGMIALETCLPLVIGDVQTDDFTADDDRTAVAARLV